MQMGWVVKVAKWEAISILPVSVPPSSCGLPKPQPLLAAAPSRKLPGGSPKLRGLRSKPPPTAHVKREFLRMATTALGNAPNVSSASS